MGIIISKPTLWAFLLIAGSLTAASLLLWHNNKLDSSKGTDQAYAEAFGRIPTEPTFLHFGPEDVTVSHKWSLLAGIHPAVTFRCHLTAPPRTLTRVILCYKPLGSSVWLTEEARIRRDSTARLTLRDLRRNTPYECFFIAQSKNTMLRSNIVQFTTNPLTH